MPKSEANAPLPNPLRRLVKALALPPRVRPVWALTASAAVAGMALSSVTRLHQRADDCRRAEVAFVRLDGVVERLNRAEWEAMSRGGVSRRTQQEIDHALGEIHDELGALGRLDADLTGLSPALKAYGAAQDLGLSMLRERRVAEAERVARTHIEPLYRRVKARLHRLEAEHGIIAARMNSDATQGSITILLASLLLIGIPAWGYHRLREAGLLAAAERRALEASERRFRALVENGSDVNLLLSPEGEILYAGPAVERAVGRVVAALLGTNWTELIHPDDHGDAQRLLAASEGPGDPITREIRLRSAAGEWRHFEVLASSRVDDPDLPGIVVNCWDVTERKRVELALRESEERYALAARGTNDGLWDWDLARNRLYLSPRWWSMLELETPTGPSRPEAWWERVHPNDLPSLRAELQRHRDGAREHFQCEYQIRTGNGQYRWVLCRGVAVHDAAGEVIRLVGSQTDVTERKNAEDQLLHAAFHDDLTGLPNRTLLMELLTTSIQRRRNSPGWNYAVLFLDLDRFKTINDSLGHTVGDKLLVSVARRLLTCVRSNDTVARLGGDEFAILVDGIESQFEAERVADRIQRELEHPFDLDGYEVYASTSIGIAGSALDYDRPDKILRDADTAMYAAKLLGKARYAIFDEHMHARVVSQLNLENDLRRALERGELFVEYQPIVEFSQLRVVGFEALVRWRHPERGVIAPAEFITLAEDSGLIVAIDRWVMRQVCRQLAEWRRSTPGAEKLTVSVNLSTRHLSQPGLIEEIDLLLDETGIPGHMLRLEITESAIIENAATASDLFEQLHRRGIQILMDDFGTGYSSLAYLHRFPFDMLKIDRSFLTSAKESEAWDVVHTIISLARVTGMQVVAEGVETSAQADRLRRLGCAFGQGYAFSRPMRGADAVALLGRSLGIPTPEPAPRQGWSAQNSEDSPASTADLACG